MAYEVATVAIRKANGKRSVIAKKNFNPKTMKLWSDPVEAPKADPVEAPKADPAKK